MLIVLRPCRAGDHVIAAGQEGTVLEIRVFQTRLRAVDHRLNILATSEINTRKGWRSVPLTTSPRFMARSTMAAP